MARFIVVVLDGFGIGAMPDVMQTRPQDLKANTALNLLNNFPERRLPTLEQLGLINAVPDSLSLMRQNKDARWGKAMLVHEGCDTFMGHNEIMGSRPKPPLRAPFNQAIDSIESALKNEKYSTKRIYRNHLAMLEVEDCVLIGDNLEAELGQVYNLTANLDQISFENLNRIGKVVRQANNVGRNIVFGGCVGTMEPIIAAIETRDFKNNPRYIGVNTPRTGIYKNGFQVIHLGYGINAVTQVPYCLAQVGVTTFLYGKVADIIHNEHGISYPSIVDTRELLKLLLADVAVMEKGFFCLNVQETDLAGHQQDPERYWQVLEYADHGIARLISSLNPDDRLVVMADHGNDPFIGHSQHTREMVPILSYPLQIGGHQFGTLDTLADVGASVSAFFSAPMPEFGKPSLY